MIKLGAVTLRLLLRDLFQSLAGLTPMDILWAFRQYLEWRINHAERIHDTEQLPRLRNLLAMLPEVIE